MSISYGLDLDKIEETYANILYEQNDKKLIELANEVIPSLIEDCRRTRKEVLNLLLK